MMFKRALSVAAIATMLLGPGCVGSGSREEPTPTPVPARVDESKQVYEVKRGSIFDTIKGLGRVVAKDELPLYFKRPGRLRSVRVEILQPVKKGDLLAELDTGDLADRIDAARIKTEIAQIEASKVIAGAGGVRSDVQQSAASVVGAQSAYTRATNELAKLESGARPADVAVAQAAVASARAAVARAESQLALLEQPPAQDEVIAARAVLDKARSIVQKAQADYDKVASAPDVQSSPQAVTLQQATADFQAAQANFNLKSAGAKPEDVASAQSNARGAGASLRSAEARLAQVQSGARSEDVEAARIVVEKATIALSETRAAYESTAANSTIDTSNFDVAMAQKKVDLARVNYDGLNEELEMARIRAPFDGIITFVTGKQGEQFDAFSPLAIISDPGTLEVSTELQSADLARVAPGQEAIVKSDAFGNLEMRGRVVRLPSFDLRRAGSGPTSQENPRAVRIKFEPPKPMLIGQLAQVTVITQQKDDIILIPNTAVRRFGNRKYVQVIGPDGRRRDQDIETGLVTDSDTEILKGLNEGQKVIVQ